MEDPIDICSDSDDEKFQSDKEHNQSKKAMDYDIYSVDGSDMLVDLSSFDADALFADNLDVFDTITDLIQESQVLSKPSEALVKPLSGTQIKSKGWTQSDSVILDKCDKPTPDLNVSLCLTATDPLRKAKRRMEYCFMDDYFGKIKAFKQEDREDYAGEYTFVVKVGVLTTKSK